MVMKGKQLKGYGYVSQEALQSKRILAFDKPLPCFQQQGKSLKKNTSQKEKAKKV